MQLKSLEMIGFKSFADKTTVTFQPGVTAVVGPNGCGKSNISDAIRWVLGEQSAKHLRGDKMEDVIFNGSENRKPLGLAEVNLTLTNVSGLSSEFGEYRELEITRRLYRSGESEYLINKIPCRLKDIRDLMMDAGVGAKVHAIIEQARVDQILSSKPQDRRFLFEEAAGIMKYKARRQEALGKLESTQQNQLRINDIITEVKRQLNSLDRQARKAERYQKLKAEMKDVEFRLASVEYSSLGGEWTASSEEFRKLEDETTRLHAELGKIESAIEETRADTLSAEREFAALQHRIHETENALRSSEHQVEMSRSQIASLMEQRGRDLRDREYLEQELARIAEQKSKTMEEAGGLAALVHDRNTVLLSGTVEFENLAQALRGKEQALEEARTGAFAAVTEAAAEKTTISNLQSRISQLDEQDGLGRKESESLAVRGEELRILVAEKEQEASAISARRNALQEERAGVAARLDQALAGKKTLEAGLGAAKDRLAARKSRLHSLLELEQSLEGYQKGVQTVMTARKQGANGQLGTIHGLVADIIETEARYETAIEAVLGDRLQNVVVGSQSDSLKAIQFLKSEGGGRSTFIPQAPREIKSEPFVKNGTAGVIGAALDIVQVKDDYRTVAQYLLGDVVLVETMDTALHLWQKNGFHKTLVTLSGEILDPWGAVTGGAVETGGAGMLGKRREIKDLEQEVTALSSQAAALESELRETEASIELETRAEAGLSQDIHKAELDLVNREKDRASLADELGRTEGRLQAVAAELAERAARRDDLSAEMARAVAALRSIEDGHSSAQASIESLLRELSAERDILEQQRASLTGIKMEVSALQEKQAGMVKQLSALDRTGEDLEDRKEKRDEEIAGIAAKVGELESAIAAAEESITAHIRGLEAERRDFAGRQEAHNEKVQALHAYEEQAREARHGIEAVQKSLSSIEVKRTELRLKIEHLKDHIWATYHTELETVVTELGEFELNVEEARSRLDEQRQKIDQMGPINIDALQEYQELKERYDLLSAQQQDINDSIANLKATIAKLDGETKELFTTAYNAIHEKFKEVFSLLFEGGRAELVLLDEANILDSGIEIIAQPRGKKFQSITLLSGGERALTAIALLFAAFLVKTSPFCMLDEVDAPLDEANVTRYTRLLREMSSHSQFIVVTHNKRTMEMADALYGITMEEPGCSKVVSVKLREPAMA